VGAGVTTVVVVGSGERVTATQPDKASKAAGINREYRIEPFLH
jgi:hypothetical protein